MPDTLPEAIEPYPEISSKAYEHPADRAATAALHSIPVLDTVVRKLVEYGYERSLRQSYLGNSIKVSERQLPDLHASYQGVHRILDMPADYDLYVSSGRTGTRSRSARPSRCSCWAPTCCCSSGRASSARCSRTSSGTCCPTT